jgi:hypothetical protein
LDLEAATGFRMLCDSIWVCSSSLSIQLSYRRSLESSELAARPSYGSIRGRPN